MIRSFSYIALPALVLSVGIALAQNNGQPSPSPSPTATSAAQQQVAVSIPQGSVGQGPQAYGENPLRVQPGTTVTWTNNDSLPHTVTADDGAFDSGTLQPGDTFSHTFDTPGSYGYYCMIHGRASMSGTILVIGATPRSTPEPGATTTPGSSPSPSSPGAPGSVPSVPRKY